MADHIHILSSDLGTSLEVVTDKVEIKIDGTLVKNADGSLGLNGGAITVVSADTGNVLVAGGDGGAFFNQAALQTIETAWTGADASGFLTVAPGGVNGHTVAYGFDFTNALFVEAVQDAIGAAILQGAGVTYDDVANAISTSLGNITFGDGLAYDAGTNTVSVRPDPASPSTISVSPAGLSVDAATQATDIVCDLAGNQLYRVFPL